MTLYGKHNFLECMFFRCGCLLEGYCTDHTSAHTDPITKRWLISCSEHVTTKRGLHANTLRVVIDDTYQLKSIWWWLWVKRTAGSGCFCNWMEWMWSFRGLSLQLTWSVVKLSDNMRWQTGSVVGLRGYSVQMPDGNTVQQNSNYPE